MAKKILLREQLPLGLDVVSKLKRNLPSIVLLLIGLLAGIFWFGALRYLLTQTEEIHYHSNFAVYIDGEREGFKSFTYYEEVAACTTAFANNPKGRVHMHSQVNDVIHVHDNAVTYADFFNNINWTLGPSFMRAENGLITNTEDKTWVYILNGKKLDRVDNLVIGGQDKLLMSYGVVNTDFSAQFNKIDNKAKVVDEHADPASCSGLNGPHDNSVGARLKKAFTFTK